MAIKQLPSRHASVFEALNKDVVAEALARLGARAIHPNFAGYLAVKRAARLTGKSDEIPCDFKEFFDLFLKVGASEQKPYLLPFTETKGLTYQNAWFNKNVAGSYAPSSIRAQSAFAKVVDARTISSTARYGLRDQHAELAFKYLLFSNPIAVADLAIVLYRDYGFESQDMKIGSLIDIFRDDFGFRAEVPEEKVAYQILFSTADFATKDKSLFETITD